MLQYTGYVFRARKNYEEHARVLEWDVFRVVLTVLFISWGRLNLKD